jgi:sialic acid synthase SpsE
VIVHQCPSGYPARLESVNLNIIPTLIRLFPECVIGFSDHNLGYEMDAAAVALGSRMIEKTLCLSREEPWPEYGFSTTPAEAPRFVEAIRAVEAGLGLARRVLTDQERRSKVSARRSAYTRAAIAEGEVLTPDLIEWRRPGGGIEPPDGARLIGWQLLRSLPAGHRLDWDYLG